GGPEGGCPSAEVEAHRAEARVPDRGRRSHRRLRRRARPARGSEGQCDCHGRAGRRRSIRRHSLGEGAGREKGRRRARSGVIAPDLFDTHAHLHFPEFAEDLDAVLERARAAGVRRILTIGTDVPTSRAAAALASREPDVWAAVGIHPHEAAEADDTALAEIERLASTPRVVAIGETGLDLFRNLAPRDAQERAFRSQLVLARRTRKPVLVHCREAHEETLSLIGEADVRET